MGWTRRTRKVRGRRLHRHREPGDDVRLHHCPNHHNDDDHNDDDGRTNDHNDDDHNDHDGRTNDHWSRCTSTRHDQYDDNNCRTRSHDIQHHRRTSHDHGSEPSPTDR